MSDFIDSLNPSTTVSEDTTSKSSSTRSKHLKRVLKIIEDDDLGDSLEQISDLLGGVTGWRIHLNAGNKCVLSPRWVSAVLWQRSLAEDNAELLAKIRVVLSYVDDPSKVYSEMDDLGFPDEILSRSKLLKDIIKYDLMLPVEDLPVEDLPTVDEWAQQFNS